MNSELVPDFLLGETGEIPCSERLPGFGLGAIGLTLLPFSTGVPGFELGATGLTPLKVETIFVNKVIITNLKFYE